RSGGKRHLQFTEAMALKDSTERGTCETARMPSISPTRCNTHVWFRAFWTPLIALVSLLSPATITAASLDPITSKAWEEYIHVAAQRMEQRLGAGKTFLWADEVPDRLT